MRISYESYHEMIASGGLKEDDRIELIQGSIVTKMSIGSHHGGMVNRLNRLLNRLLGDWSISTQTTAVADLGL